MRPKAITLKDLLESLWRVHRNGDIPDRLSHWSNWFERRKQGDGGNAAQEHVETVNEYYDLCNPLMKYWWNESLHFAPLTPDESLPESIARHQRRMIERLELAAGMRVVDVGCGLGGPMRRVAGESGAHVVGVNNNQQQLDDARRMNVAAGLDHLAETVKCDFMDMSALAAHSFDAGYAIESTCHAPDKARAFAEIFRLLKPGGRLWGQEMCMTEAFDPNDGSHRTVKERLMRGIALKEIATFTEVNRALEAAGFEILEATDFGSRDGGTPWYLPMEGRRGTLRGIFRGSSLGRRAAVAVLRILELSRVLPVGSAAILDVMDRTAEAYVTGGKMGLFTPLYCFLARKPG